MSYAFPIALMLNTFSMTALLVGLGLAGKTTMAAEVGIVQGATLALFYTFSANARNIILNPSSRISVRWMVGARALLSVPLAIVAFYLSVYLADVAKPLALILILRRCSEWIGELHLSEMELRGDRTFATRFIGLQSILLFVALGSALGYLPVPSLGLFPWALSPLLMSLGFIRYNLVDVRGFRGAWIQMLPHLGSTAMVGITVYVFRLLILLIVGKETAGDLYTAFAIGGVMGAVFTNAVGPSLVLNEVRSGEGHLPAGLKISLSLWFVAGVALFLAAEFLVGALDWIGKSHFFWGATGLSMIGGVVMVFAQHIRLRSIQLHEGQDVYGPDVLMNILILISVPYLFYLWGRDALMALYLINSILALLFYASSKGAIGVGSKSIGLSGDTCRLVISILLFFPLFFQLTGNIFQDSTFIYDSQGALMRVPLPVSLLACFGGIPLLGGYKRAYLSLGVIFMSFVLMLVSCVVSTQGRVTEEQGKLILLLQFIVPMCALVLGQLYEGDQGKSYLVEKVFLYIVSVLVPVQLVLTWLQGHIVLSPYLYAFSIYQHLEYVPVIFVSGYLIAFYSLWDLPQYKKMLLILAPLMGVYVSASTSMMAMVALSGGVLGFVVYRWRDGFDKALRVAFLLVIVTLGSYLNVARSTTYWYAEKFKFVSVAMRGAEVEETERVLPNMTKRRGYWQHYGDKVLEGTKPFLFGQAERPDRSEYPSAHNYYLDFVYNFGFLAVLPLMGVLAYTVLTVYRARRTILASSSLLGLTVVVLLLLFVDNSLKVGLRQPYPGIISFFLWAVLLSRLSKTSGVEVSS